MQHKILGDGLAFMRYTRKECDSLVASQQQAADRYFSATGKGFRMR
jgi:hypothetical protein